MWSVEGDAADAVAAAAVAAASDTQRVCPSFSLSLSLSSVVLLNAVPELPPELATVSTVDPSVGPSVRPPGRFFALLFPTVVAVVRRHAVRANGELHSERTMEGWSGRTG